MPKRKQKENKKIKDENDKAIFIHLYGLHMGLLLAEQR